MMDIKYIYQVKLNIFSKFFTYATFEVSNLYRLYVQRMTDISCCLVGF